MPPAALVDPSTIDCSHPAVDLEGIREGNPQRFEMEQLTGIVRCDVDQNLIIGYKDIKPDEFWVRGHLPDYPIMPGVLMCEAAAQLASYFCHVIGIVKDGFLGFGGMEEVRFRGPVHIGDRLVIVVKADKVHRRQTIFNAQAFVDTNMVFHAKIIGVPLPTRQPKAAENAEV